MELTEEVRKEIILVANTNLLVGLSQAVNDQILFIEKSGFKGKRKQDFQIFINASNKLIKSMTNIGNDEENDEALKISDEIHDLLFNMRARIVKEYTNKVLDV